MTKTSRKWRDKKIKKIRVYRKIHNSILGLVTGVMAVFFLLSLCATLNKYTITMFLISTVWISLFAYANNLEHLEEGEE